MRTTLCAVVVAGLVASVIVPTASATQTDSEPPPRPIVWLAIGDSYSSGTGVENRRGTCRRSTDAYAPRVLGRLQSDGWDMGGWAFTACHGATVSFRPVLSDPDFHFTVTDGQRSLAQQVIESDTAQSTSPVISTPGEPPVKVDLMTFSFGGNDIGFAEIIRACAGLDIRIPWRSYRCPYTTSDLEDRVNDLKNTNNLTRRGLGIKVWDEDPQAGSLADFYQQVHRHHITIDGSLIVMGYPRLFADPDQWLTLLEGDAAGATPLMTNRCERISRRDARMLNEVAETLDEVIRGQVESAAESGPYDTRYISLIRYQPEPNSDGIDTFRDGIPDFSDGGHQLCGNGDTWLTGWLGLFSRRPGDSYHPNQEGHAAMAELLYQQIQRMTWDASAPDPGETTPPNDEDDESPATPDPPTDPPDEREDDDAPESPDPTSPELDDPDEPEPELHSVVAEIDVAGAVAIESGAGAVWVGGLGGREAAVHKIDPVSNRILGSVPAEFPSSLAVGLGSVWVASSPDFDTLLLRIDPETAQVTGEVRLDAFGPSLAVGAGSVWVSDASGRRVLRVDPDSLEVTATIPVGWPSAVTFGGGALWVANHQDVTVSRVDPTTNTVTHTIDLDVGPRGCCTSAHGIAYGAGAVWVGVTDDPGNAYVVRINPETRRNTARVEIGPASMSYSRDMLSASSSSVWVTNTHDGTISRIDTATNRVTATVSVGGRPQGIEVTGSAVWVGRSVGVPLARVEPP